MEYLIPVACVHIRGVSPIQGAGLEGFHCTYVYQRKDGISTSRQRFLLVYKDMDVQYNIGWERTKTPSTYYLEVHTS